MITKLLVFFSLVLILGSCETMEVEENQISEEHAALVGVWYENDSIAKTTWVFEKDEVKWKGFTHFYKVSGDSLMISGLVFTILEQTEKKR